MEQKNQNPGTELPNKFPVVDLWPDCCSICGNETEAASEFVVYTAQKGEKKRTGGYREYSTPYYHIQEHPCRVCETCEKESGNQLKTILIGGILAGIFSCLIFSSISDDWTATICISILLPVIIIGGIGFTVDNKRQEQTANRAANVRGVNYVGLSTAALEKIEKSKDIPILE